MIAILMMVGVNFLMARLERPSASPEPLEITEALPALAPASGPEDLPFCEAEVLTPPPAESAAPRVTVLRNVKTIEMAAPAGVSVSPQDDVAAYEETAVPPPPVPSRIKKTPYSGKVSRIVLIIDDMGLTPARDKSVVAMPGAVTLAYLPYAPNVARQAEEARAKGHELLIHTPMEPMNGRLDMGPIALKEGMSEAAFKAVLREQVFPAFSGYIGINNHMGSRLTQDKQAMRWVMEELKARNLAFVDSVTIQTSVAARTAQEYGVPFAVREVFLDHDEREGAVHKQLAELERRARKEGYAVAIGHPKPHTIHALQQWIPGLKERGFELVPVSAVLEKPEPVTKTASTR